jgi:hypothetical protein
LHQAEAALQKEDSQEVLALHQAEVALQPQEEGLLELLLLHSTGPQVPLNYSLELPTVPLNSLLMMMMLLPKVLVVKLSHLAPPPPLLDAIVV